MQSGAPTNINNNFFDGLYQNAWRGLMPPGLTTAEVEFIWEVAGLEPGAKVLDLMCGYGRHAIELAGKAASVTAVDNLANYTNEIAEIAKTQDLSIQALQADVANWQATEIFDAAICMGNSFAFFDKENALSILKNVSAHLKPGGVFIVNSWMIAEIAIKHFKERDWHSAGDYQCVLQSKFLFSPTRIETQQTIIGPGDVVQRKTGVDYIFTLNELEEMFQQTGLATKHLYSTPRKKSFSLGDGAVYIVVEKV